MTLTLAALGLAEFADVLTTLVGLNRGLAEGWMLSPGVMAGGLDRWIIYKLLTLAIVAWVVMVMRKRWVPRWFWPILRLELVGLTAIAMFVVASNLTLLGWL